jgi:hypothetical protein
LFEEMLYAVTAVESADGPASSPATNWTGGAITLVVIVLDVE